MNQIAPDEKIVEKFHDGTYILGIKQVNPKGRVQYRNFHICEKKYIYSNC